MNFKAFPPHIRLAMLNALPRKRIKRLRKADRMWAKQRLNQRVQLLREVASMMGGTADTAARAAGLANFIRHL